MQHKYVGDVGDYIKLALLRQLSPGDRLGVVWWRFPDEVELNDGRHVDYLRKEDWRRFDPPLFDALRQIVDEERRELAALQTDSILPGATFVDAEVPIRTIERKAWIEEAVQTVQGCDVVFLDPDNGLEPRTFVAGRKKAGKSVAYEELSAFRAPGRTVIVYHHQTRARGGHHLEIQNLAGRLSKDFKRIDAIRASPYSPRVFFLLDASPEHVARAEELCERWGEKLQLNPHLSASALKPH